MLFLFTASEKQLVVMVDEEIKANNNNRLKKCLAHVCVSLVHLKNSLFRCTHQVPICIEDRASFIENHFFLLGFPFDILLVFWHIFDLLLMNFINIL